MDYPPGPLLDAALVASSRVDVLRIDRAGHDYDAARAARVALPAALAEQTAAWSAVHAALESAQSAASRAAGAGSVEDHMATFERVFAAEWSAAQVV